MARMEVKAAARVEPTFLQRAFRFLPPTMAEPGESLYFVSALKPLIMAGPCRFERVAGYWLARALGRLVRQAWLRRRERQGWQSSNALAVRSAIRFARELSSAEY